MSTLHVPESSVSFVRHSYPLQSITDLETFSSATLQYLAPLGPSEKELVSLGSEGRPDSGVEDEDEAALRIKSETLSFYSQPL